MNNAMDTVLFYVLALIVIIAACGIVYCKNLVHSALFMTLCFISIAGLYVLLNADFLAAVQLMVYAGTVVILIALGIMMTRRISMDRSNMAERKYTGWVKCISVVLFICLSYIFINFPVPLAKVNTVQDTVAALAQLLLGHYVLAFEIAAVLLLAAMIGAVVLAKGADDK
ncbi:NADH-quinone oxidoreductase subunit J family protein [Pectinatus sottacetonis]|uniref:NADH-quinone oxidoreductase subunit J family protein n=1 Tax=Pectinatus sottacetonis TaxID=1002795 RepID=UPI0018C7E4E8|nr:NADH-quinone oxidoreductase subunit J [Pectinatus sottacetonis]